ncbi:hypothetical protein AB0F81_40295 [Actinoplanes sp. NPDC024001]|uniref:hypothetical protein n=1 Tax=Actinoplanes sp. NPDC024001 TaxID=3154598 RepID=UPI0033C69A0E
MLQIDKVQTIEGVTVHTDGDSFSTFYLIPEQPRYRRYPDGTLAFRFIKYRFAVDRPGDRKGGGFVLFDVEFVVDEAKLPVITEKLQAQVNAEAARRGITPAPPVTIGTISYTKGTSALIVPGAGGFVEKEHNPGMPSLFGRNICSFGLELSQDGAEFFEKAMQGQGGTVSVVYNMWLLAQLPKIEVNAHFRASTFYSFFQTIHVDWNFWGLDSYRETLREQMISSESMVLDFKWGGVTDEKIRGPIRDWATRTLEDAVERKMIKAIAPVPDDQRDLPDGIEDVTRDISKTQISNVDIHYRESQTVEWNIAPQGILQNITALKDGAGAPVKWEDYATTIDLNSDFFRELRVDVNVNGDFTNLPIHSVEVQVLYHGRPMPNLTPGQPEGEVVLKSPDEIGKFATYVDGDDWNYQYRYRINYRGTSGVFESGEKTTNEGNLVFGVDDVGILSVEASTGADLNWEEVDTALVTFHYADDDVAPIEEQFQLTKANHTKKIQKVILKPMRKEYRYRVRYFMKGGKEVEGPELTSRAPNLVINDVFGGRRTVYLRGVGDFTNRVQNVFVNLEYRDDKNKYTQARSQALSSAMPSFDWSFPVIDETVGDVFYSATIAYKDGTSEEIPRQVATSSTIPLPPPVEAFLDVTIVPDLLDWSRLRLVRAALSYTDLDASIAVNKDFIFSPSKTATQTWRVELKDKDRDQFSYTITYFLTDGTQRTVKSDGTVDDRTLILDFGG